MKLVGAGNQSFEHYLYRADKTMTGSAVLVLGQSQSRSLLMLQNLGAAAMYVEFGAGSAHATLTNGVVTSVTVDNGGFGFTNPPLVRFLGGGQPPAYSNDAAHVPVGVNSSYVGLGQPNAPAPSHVAAAHAVLTTGAVSSIVVDDGGSGYKVAPYVLLIASDLDPNGAATPSATSGITLPANMTAPLIFNGTCCPTDAISAIGTNTQVLLCRYMD